MTEATGADGPYEAVTEAIRDAADVYEQFRERGKPGLTSFLNTQALLHALDAAGVQVGTYDRQIVGWIAGWEPHMVQVVIGWIERAHR